jgi:plastocyanin
VETIERRARWLVLGFAAVLLAGAGSCGRRAPRTHEVVIRAMAFEPAALSVELGDIVVWKNEDFFPHTATAAGAFDSGSIASQGVWRYETRARGTHAYVCTLHPTMKGELTVH